MSRLSAYKVFSANHCFAHLLFSYAQGQLISLYVFKNNSMYLACSSVVASNSALRPIAYYPKNL
jgi:hypothetical protein